MPGRRRDTFVVDPGPIGARIRRIRTDRGLTRGQLTGVPRRTVEGIEKGESLPSLDTAIRLADALNVTLDHLIGRPTASPTAARPAIGQGAGSSTATDASPPGCADGGDLEQTGSLSPSPGSTPTAASTSPPEGSPAVGLLEPDLLHR